VSAARLERELLGSLIWNSISDATKRGAAARKPIIGDRSLWFIVGGEYRHATHKIVIELDPCEVYTVRYLRVDRATWESLELARVEYVNADSLDGVIDALVSA